MKDIHLIFRDSLAQAPQLVGSVREGDLDRAALVASFYDHVLGLLHVHHEGEDLLLWPKLLERSPESAEMVNRIAHQHDGVNSGLADAEAKLAIWRQAPDVESAVALAVALTSLRAVLVQHLDEEEANILPLAAEHFTIAEWAEFPAHGMQHFKGDKMWLLIGMILDHMTEEHRTAMLTHMPPPVHEFWVNAGQPQYQAFMAQLKS